MAVDLKLLEKQRTALRAGVTRACNIIKDELEKAAVTSEETLSDCINQLDAKEPKLETISNKVLVLLKDDEQDKELEEIEKYNERLVHWRGRAKRWLSGKNSPTSSVGHGRNEDVDNIEVASNRSSAMGRETTATVSLPKLEIRKYDGNPDKWQAFWTQFKGAIHENPNLSSADKFNYLKSYLEGDAWTSVDGLTFTQENYESAIADLINRFGNKGMQVSTRLGNFLQMSPVLKSTDIAGLRKLHDSCVIEVRNLAALGHLTDSYGELLAHIVGGLIPLELLEQYTRGRDEETLWKIKDLLGFLNDEIQCRERALAVHKSRQQQLKANSNHTQKPVVKNYQNNKSEPPFKPFSAAALNTGITNNYVSDLRKCIFCESTEHPYYNCCKEISIPERRAIVSQKKLCFLCFKPGHPAHKCRGRIQNCRICHRKHHQIICENTISKPPVQSERSNARSEGQNSVTLNTGSDESSVILLQTARADIRDSFGRNLRVRCVLDGASHRSFIKEDVSRKLNLEVVGNEVMSLFPFESQVPIRSNRRKVKVGLRNINTGEEVTIIALETPSINGAVFAVPGKSVREQMREKNLQLSDLFGQENEENSSPIEVLIGADYFWRVANGQFERLSPDLMAINTVLGWTVQGRTEGEESNTEVKTIAVNHVAIEREETLVSDQLRAFWNLESLGIQDKVEERSNERETMLSNFEENISFKEGRYQVALPWKPNKELMGDNLEVAKRRTINLVSKLESKPEEMKKYNEIIEEQLKSGIVERVDDSNDNHEVNTCYYIPHRGVVRESRETTKLRIVYDASSHAKNSPSLNECVEAGPNLVPELFKILIGFRKHRVAFTGDIEKAFHQISIVERDRDALRFFWVKGLVGAARRELVTYRITRVPFGCTASPFLLAATIKYHAKKYMESHPRASEVLSKDLYVDDLVSGEGSTRKANQTIKQASEILGKAGMNLRKFHSNSREIRKKWGDVTQVERESDISAGETEKVTQVLGMTWNEFKDTFHYDVSERLKFLLTRENTKRWVLRAVARVFDPLGLLSPFTIRAKLIFQEMWKKGLDWDTPLTGEIAEEFDAWCAELSHLVTISIPRYYFSNEPGNEEPEIEMHGFVDASQKAYAAVVYLRGVYANGEVHTSMVAAKARVAPIQALSLPRLELMGGLLGARLMKSLVQTLGYSPRLIRMWTDSTIVLHWIRDNAARWKPFVSNRVKEIQGMIDPSCWNHVAGRENPADLPSRGGNMEEFVKSDLWLHGPTWLSKDEQMTDLVEVDEESPAIKVEKRGKGQVVLAIPVNTLQPIIKLEKYSSAMKVFRVTAWVLRFVENLKRKQRKSTEISGPLLTDEINNAEKYWVKLAQEEHFAEEINSLKTGVGISKNSKILSLSPTLDKDGLLRLGGRLEAANISYEERHPWILSHKNLLTELIIVDCHVKLKHAGVDDILVEIREKFWVNKLRRAIKSKVQGCPRCKRFRARATITETAPLPEARINPSPPFSVCGIDFAGPLFTKDGQKCYIALYTCAVTRAVHLEVVSDLTTEKFLLSFRRFIARRGITRIIYSDNAKTFKRAEIDLNELIQNLRHPEVANYFGSLRIQWRYIADRAAWWGGFWERMVRSVKSSLRKTLGKARLTYEELETILIEIEATVNSRPISYVYEGAGEPAPLIPAHFLTGKRLTSLPSRVFANDEVMNATREALTKRLKYQQTLLDSFWKRWKTNYLLDLRSAHHKPSCTPSEPLKVNDVVLIEENKTPRLMWRIAVIEETMMGRDGVVRSCMVRLPNGNRLRRPVQLLYPLEI